jgi:hypothetical protein
MHLDSYLPIEKSDSGHLLENPVSWYPEYKGERIVFAATDKGERVYLGSS